MKTAIRNWLGFGLICALSGISCQGRAPAGEGVHVHAIPEDPQSLDPAVAYDGVSWKILGSIYETLYQYDYFSDPYRVIPLLAADFPMESENGLMITIPIRKGILFHEDVSIGKSRELTADDWVYAFKRLALPSIRSPGAWVFEEKVAGFSEFRKKLAEAQTPEQQKDIFEEGFKGFEVPNRYTLRIRLVRRYPQLLYALTLPFTAAMAPEVVSKHAGSFLGVLTDVAVGTGPFQLKSYRKGVEWILARHRAFHPDFFPTHGALTFRQAGDLADAGRALPLLDEVRFQILRDEPKIWTSFLEGKLDLIRVPGEYYLSVVQGDELSSDLKKKGMRLYRGTSLRFSYLTLNMRHAVLGRNKSLRQALSSALDRERWMSLSRQARGEVMTAAIPVGVPGRPADRRLKYGLDLDRARQLLARAGYRDGKGLPVLRMDMRGNDAHSRETGDFLFKEMAKIGVKIQVIYNTFPVFMEKLRKGDFDLAEGGWTLDFPEAENVYQLLYGKGSNETGFNHMDFNRLFEKLSTETLSDQRIAIIRKMEDILQEEMPWIYGYVEADVYLTQPWFKNFRPSQMIPNPIKYWRIEQKSRSRYQDKN